MPKRDHRHFVPIQLFLALLACLPGLALAAGNDACAELQTKITIPMIITIAGLALTLAIVSGDGAEQKAPPEAKSLDASSYRLKALGLVALAVAIKTVLTSLDADAGWGDALLAFNSALAGVYASRGWLAMPGPATSLEPTASQKDAK
jgi:hypothetical protein